VINEKIGVVRHKKDKKRIFKATLHCKRNFRG